MKNLLAFAILTASVGAFAQERLVLNSKEVSINASSATIVRTSKTADKVEITFQVPMANSICAETRQVLVPRTCYTQERIYTIQRVCKDVVVTIPAPPRGPNYRGSNAPTTRVERRCEDVRVDTGRVRQIPYNCSFTTTECARYATVNSTESDKVKIKFKNLPKLGGSEEETFTVTARQRSYDGSNVVYDIKPVSTLNNAEYEVDSKGIFGVDSYVIQPK